MKKTLLVMLSLALLFSFGACQKKEEEPEVKSQPPTGPIIDAGVPGLGEGGPAVQGHGTGLKTEFSVVVPQEVQDYWGSAVFIIEDKQENSKDELTVKIGDEFKIPGSGLVVKTGPFLPDFKMSAETITSTSNNPNNPAIGVEIYENGVKVFPASGKWGWLYVNFPTIHSFEHSRYALALKEGVKK
jgi:hypothetical protein